MSNGGSGERLEEVVDRLQGEVAELRQSRRRLAEANHADRRAIERALHDGLQQRLVAFAVDLRRLARLVEGDVAAATTLLDQLLSDVQEALDETTSLALMIDPPLLDGRWFATTLRSAAERAGVAARVVGSAGASCPPEIMAAVYWCCVEAFSSASAGSEATVTLLRANGTITFEVAVAGHHPEGRLDRMRDGVAALGGRVAVQDMEDGGSLVQGFLPLAP